MKITDVLKQEHRVIEVVLDCLEKISERASFDGALDRETAGDALTFLRTFADRCHHGKEEDRLFPAMVAKGVPGNVGPVGVMLSEHETGRAAVRAMGEALEDPGEGSVERFVHHARTFVELLRDHIAKEDNILFPMADSVLGEAEQEALWNEFERIESEDMGGGLHQEMEAIAQRLAERYGVPTAAERGQREFSGCCHQHEGVERMG